MQQASNPLDQKPHGALLALRFGAFELDLRAGEMKRHGSSVKIQPQPFKVLVLLASRPGEVVTREEIQADVWPAGTFVDFEQSLNFCIRQIRSALGDNALSPRYIETLPRRGYRWVGGPVERVAAPARVHEFPRPLAPNAVPAGGTAEDFATPPAGLPLAALPLALPPARRPFRVPMPLALAAVAALSLAFGLALSRWREAAPAPAEPPAFNRLTFRRGLVGSARFAPDGQVVFSAAWDGLPSRLFVTRSDPRDARALDVEDAFVVGVTGDGEVAFLRDRVLARAPLAGGPHKDVLKGVVAADAAPGGSDFAVARVVDDRLQLELPVGRTIGPIVRPGRLRVSPDGRHLALTVHPQLDDDRGDVVVLDRSGRRVAAAEGWGSLEGLAWSGSEVWFTATRVGADNALHALSLDGRVRTVLAGMGRLVLHDVAPDGRVLLERATLRAEMLFARAGREKPVELSWLDFSGAVALSADGSSLLFYESGQGGGPDYTTFVRRTDGGPPVRVGTGRAVGLSADGQWVLSIPLRNPDHVDVVPVGPGEAREIRLPGSHVYEMAGFVPGGRAVFVTVRAAADRRASFLVDPDGKNPRPLPMPEGRGLFVNTFSPDGTRFLASCKEMDGVCVYRVDGGAPVALRGVERQWRPIAWDARDRLYFRDPMRRVPGRLWRLDLAGGRAQLVADLAPEDLAGAQAIMGAVVSHDGEARAFSVMRRLSDLHVVTGLR
jgi:DNA-binding winged helix-turn-helix (wHTH) protein